ncbi:protein pygopus-like [Coccinella septempunctata]|uniref:protein pygopus-like n=1 Tax=Coccinella septempunctata TaxID=41139 RepID=UPI001D068C50|nr:protein pygopus-like [Coccinella septempunctata]
MSHLSPFRLNPNLGPDLGGTAPNPKKRRKNSQVPIQTPPNVQDLLPPPLTGYGDTIVASNPFDDCPSNVNSMGSVRNNSNMGMQGNMPMGVNAMGMCRPMGPGMGMNSPMMHSPNAHHGMMNNQVMMNNPRMNGPMGNHMGPHMMHSPNGPMHGISGPVHSPIGNMNSGIQGPHMPGNGSSMSGPGPINNGPMNGPMNGMNTGMGGGMQMNASNAPMGPSLNNNFMMNNMYSKPMPVSAGKVYPADQPMVFNAQNPNAPPIYPCGVCHKEVHDNDQAILCESGCNFWFHRGCTGLTETAYSLLTAEVYAEWVCDKCLSSKTIPLVKFKP